VPPLSTSKKRKVNFASEELSAKKPKGSNGGLVETEPDSDAKTAKQTVQRGRSKSVSGRGIGGGPTASSTGRSNSASHSNKAALTSGNGRRWEDDNAERLVPVEKPKKAKEVPLLHDVERYPALDGFSSSPLLLPSPPSPEPSHDESIPTGRLSRRVPSIDLRSISAGLPPKPTTQADFKEMSKKTTSSKLKSTSFPEQLAGLISQNAGMSNCRIFRVLGLIRLFSRSCPETAESFSR
jgi:hypothetical protein